MDDYAQDSAFQLVEGAALAAVATPAQAPPYDAAGHAHPVIGTGRLDGLIKRGIDIVGSLLLLLLLAPLLLATALALRASGGPALFKQSRVGRHGRLFTCYKFRSMVPDAERVLAELLQRDPAANAEWQQAQKLRHDPRITPLGALLRRASVDELPQLWNVLRGDMSLVGPRPILPGQLALYGPLAACYTSARPGITGLWQVTARGSEDFGRRIALDCEYARRITLYGDLLILLKTVSVVMSGRGAY